MLAVVTENGSARAASARTTSEPAMLAAGTAASSGGSVIDEDERIDETSGERRRFASVILPPWCRKFPQIYVLAALPKSAQPGAKRALAEIWNAEDRDHARRAVATFKLACAAKFGKADAKVIKGPGSKTAGLAIAFKLIESAQQRWRAVNAPQLVVLGRAGARFERGRLVERPTTSQHQPDAA